MMKGKQKVKASYILKFERSKSVRPWFIVLRLNNYSARLRYRGGKN